MLVVPRDECARWADRDRCFINFSFNEERRSFQLEIQSKFFFFLIFNYLLFYLFVLIDSPHFLFILLFPFFPPSRFPEKDGKKLNNSRFKFFLAFRKKNENGNEQEVYALEELLVYHPETQEQVLVSHPRIGTFPLILTFLYKTNNTKTKTK